MSGKIQKLRQELTELEGLVEELSITIHEKYTNYIQLLSQSVNQQLVVAVYQLCTQAYPQEFLALSYNQRQKLQGEIKAIVKTTQAKLLKLPEVSPQSIETQNFEFSKNQSLLSLKPQEPSFLPSPSPQNIIKNPDILMNWCKTLEKEILGSLNQLSKEANYYLQQAHILPSKLPSRVLDMAIQAEEAGQPMTGGTNLLNVLVETENKNNETNEKEAEEPLFPAKVTKITAIHLRLGEIEFADPSLSIGRNQIRSLLEQLDRIHKQYHKKQKEYAVAEAESAWRSSWYED